MGIETNCQSNAFTYFFNYVCISQGVAAVKSHLDPPTLNTPNVSNSCV